MDDLGGHVNKEDAVHREGSLVLEQLASCRWKRRIWRSFTGFDLGDEALVAALHEEICPAGDLVGFSVDEQRPACRDLSIDDSIPARRKQALGASLAVLGCALTTSVAPADTIMSAPPSK